MSNDSTGASAPEPCMIKQQTPVGGSAKVNLRGWQSVMMVIGAVKGFRQFARPRKSKLCQCTALVLERAN